MKARSICLISSRRPVFSLNRRVLDEPVPALGDKTPLQCVRSKQGREKIIESLKLLENNEERRAASQGQQPYDSRWMWDELKLGRYRASPP